MEGSEIVWRSAPAELALTAQAVHLWRGVLEVEPEQLQQFARSLSPDEQARADRFRFPHDRDRFIAGRGMLRSILGRYLQRSPAQVAFAYEPHGKPKLQSGGVNLQFNLSHSATLMLCAVTSAQQVGVDVEQLRTMSDLAGLTSRFFAPSEHDAIQALPAAQQATAFFRYWTCKEAILKAIGTGLGGLETVEIACREDGVEFIRFESAGVALSTWRVYSFVPALSYFAAVAVPIAEPTFSFWQWQD